MEGLEQLSFLTENEKDLLLNSEKVYRKNASIYFRVHEFDEKKSTITIKVWQRRNSVDKYLSTEELRERTKDVFNMLENRFKVHIHAREFLAYGLSNINIEQIKQNAEKLNLSQSDLASYLGVHKSILSEWFSGNKELTNIHKTMFFYFFKSYLANK